MNNEYPLTYPISIEYHSKQSYKSYVQKIQDDEKSKYTFL